MKISRGNQSKVFLWINRCLILKTTFRHVNGLASKFCVISYKGLEKIFLLSVITFKKVVMLLHKVTRCLEIWYGILNNIGEIKMACFSVVFPTISERKRINLQTVVTSKLEIKILQMSKTRMIYHFSIVSYPDSRLYVFLTGICCCNLLFVL